jgi:hypothetical protein
MKQDRMVVAFHEGTKTCQRRSGYILDHGILFEKSVTGGKREVDRHFNYLPIPKIDFNTIFYVNIVLK